MSDSIYLMTKMTFKSNFWLEIIKGLSSCTQCSDGRHYITLPPVVYHFFSIILYHEFDGRIEKSVTNGDPEDGFFFPALTRIMDYFSCSPVF